MSYLDQALVTLKHDEGFRAHPYSDTVGILTIGYGRNLKDTGVSEPEASVLLQNDIQHAASMLATQPWWMLLNDPRKAVLINMTVNMGLTRLLGFKKMIAAIQATAWHIAASEMLGSQWAMQVGQRATRLAHTMETGV